MDLYISNVVALKSVFVTSIVRYDQVNRFFSEYSQNCRASMSTLGLQMQRLVHFELQTALLGFCCHNTGEKNQYAAAVFTLLTQTWR